ncbi:RDD family protein [Mycetocola manganoxydans]|uniref:RDD family protein n=1 Tax=Mycetocola manganoxydans TaxID=699879 RepID=A0A3L6ZVC1_9MICO|nr:RDD family protein [Mycetocola manganoxydans]RLP71789.1 RDD family protein [Mycetocola manganoxydans]GHD39597.1 RDD family protein [Mycetocola manganoxydans]
MSSVPKSAAASGGVAPSKYPGERLGLPEHGPRSVARAGRRLAALAIDWSSALLIVWVFFPATLSVGNGWSNSVAFAVLQIIFLATTGGSVGHRLLGLRVVPLAGGYVGLWRPVVRALLLTLVLPAIIWDSDQRGFHDKLAGTVLIRA